MIMFAERRFTKEYVLILEGRHVSHKYFVELILKSLDQRVERQPRCSFNPQSRLLKTTFR